MALNAYLKLKGDNQGQIKGGVVQKGREDSIMVIAFDHEVAMPVDGSTGQPSGKRQHGPLTITKEIDEATPLLMRALVDNETIIEWELEFWRPSRTGQEEQFYTIELRNAWITAIRGEMLNNKYPENMQHKEREHISFTYETISWRWVDGGIETTDEWVLPR